MPSMATLYHKLLESSPALPARVLEGAALAAKQGPNSSALPACLAGRADIPDRLVDELLKLDNPRVDDARKVAVRARLVGAVGDRVPEHRSTVLARNMRNEWSPNGLLVQDAIDAFMAKPTRALFDALMRRPVTWYTPEETAALLKFADANRYAYDPDKAALYERERRLGNDQAAALLSTCKSPEVAFPLLTTQVDTTAVIDFLARWRPAQWEHRTKWIEFVMRATDCHRTAQEREEILDAVAKVRELSGEHAAQVEEQRRASFRVHEPIPWDTRPAERPRPAAALDDAAPETLLAYAASRNPREQAAAIAAIARRENLLTVELGQVLAAAMTNPHATEEVLNELAQTLTDNRNKAWRAIEYSSSGMSCVDPLDLYDWDTPIVRAWIEIAPHNVLARHGWEPFRSTVTELWNRWRPPRTGFLQIVHAVNNRALSNDDLLATPMWAIHALVEVKSGAATAVKLARLLDRGLETSTKLQVFNSLGDTFDGTLGELLALCSEMVD